MFLNEINKNYIAKPQINKNMNYGNTPIFQAMFDNATANIIGTPRRTTFEYQIYSSPTINTIINKQLSINTQTLLKLFETKQGKDTETKNEGANKLLNALLNPNTAPALLSWNDIVKYFYQRYFTNGIGALVFTYDGAFDKDAKYQEVYDSMEAEQKMKIKQSNIRLMQQLEIESVQPAKYVQYNIIHDTVYYDITLYNHTSTLRFQKDGILDGFYTAKDGNNFYIAFIFGNYNFQNARYETFLNHIQSAILLENNVNTTFQAFYENACMPSSIINVKPSISDTAGVQYFYDKFGNGNEDQAKFTARVQEIKADIMSSRNTGKPLMSNDPRITYEVVPLQITPDASNGKALEEMAKNTIYSFFAGASRAAYEGTNEYASNAEPKLKELYDGSIGFLQSNLIDELNRFLRAYLRAFKIVPITQINNFYFSLDKSYIEFYKERQKTIYSQDYKNGEITLNEMRSKKAMLDEVNYGDFIDLPNGDRLFQELTKTTNETV